MKKYIKTIAISLALGFSGLTVAQQVDTLGKIKSSGSISLGVRSASGLSFATGNGEYGGFHTAMAKVIAADLQKKLNMPKLDVKLQEVTSQNRIPLVLNGTVDLECGSTTNTTARQKDVDFAMTTYIEEGRIATKVDSGIKTLADLNGRNVGTTGGTTSMGYLRKQERAAGADYKEVIAKDHGESWLNLETGRVDVFVMDGSVLAANKSKSKNPGAFTILPEVLSLEPIACMLPKGDTAFKNAVDESIKRQIADGSLAKLYDKWFMQPIAPSNSTIGLPLSAATKEAWANPNTKPMEAYNAK